jgi:phage N-6-adenine-methyltransferase
MVDKILFSSATDMWSTPQATFDIYNAIHNFELDVCATHENAKCFNYFTEQDDGLSKTWAGSCWMNPPYGDPEYVCKKNCIKKICKSRGYHNLKYVPGIADWMKKAYESSLSGAKVVCLVPARTDTAWWHDYAMKGEIEFLRGRLKFGDAKNCAPFPSAVVILGEIKCKQI